MGGAPAVHFKDLSELRPDSPDPWFWHRGWLWTRWASDFCDTNGSEEPLGPSGSPPKYQEAQKVGNRKNMITFVGHTGAVELAFRPTEV